MIVAAGLSPTWQYLYGLDRLVAGEVNRARKVQQLPSGKGYNVAIALGHLGVDCEAVGVINEARRNDFEQPLIALGVKPSFVSIRSQTRTCISIVDQSTDHTTELVENAGPISSAELEEFLKAFRAAASRARLAVISGSLPQGAPLDTFARLIAAAPCPVILDACNRELLSAVERGPYLVKLNRSELSRTVGKQLSSESDVLAGMESLKNLGAKRIVVTDGANAFLAIAPEGRWRVWPPSVRLVNGVGSGDAMAAGIALGVSYSDEFGHLLCFAAAAGAENASRLLPCRVELECVRRLAAQARVEQI